MENSSNWPGVDAIGLQRGTIYVLLSFLVGLSCLFWLNNEEQDAREPRLVKPKIPILGHLIGTLKHQVEYPEVLSSQVKWPIFTVKIFSTRIYIINSGELIQAVFRNAKTLSFDPIIYSASERVFGLTKRQMAILRTPRPGYESEFPLSDEARALGQKTLIDKDTLQDMTARGLARFADIVHGIDHQRQSVNLYHWIQQTMSISSADALYGPENPISEDVSRIKTLNDFEIAIPLLFLDFFPSIIASKGYRARAAFGKLFGSYYKNNHHLKSSGIIRTRHGIFTAHGLTTDDFSQWDIGLLDAATLNSNPASFYLLCNIFSSPELLSRLRAELQHITTRTSGHEARIEISRLNERCPLLVSAWQETLRLVDSTVSNRVVLEDTLLAGKYLLKKGGVLQLACGPAHLDPATWGDDAHLFKAERFLSSTVEKLDREQRRSRKLGYIPFGGGTNLCPGRYFATREILGVAATMIMGFDISTTSGEVIVAPPFKKKVFGEQVAHPAHDVPVVIARRKEWHGVKWGYDFGNSGEGREGLEF